ncbi:nucleotide-binding universal stress UspA family protein [Rhizobium sp. BK316]|uniref:universal stress protein n=1 Tax=Rhizobium sp. BK316 TaxID=2587053 RepID=UPI0016208CD5|nr:universal stress protein [Rhizobium sp. BK316]MBB3410828.1 nucleotide-binding universal stress UspA family protein [Rhizobium sp. BK316]
MYNRILLPTDGSELAARGVDHGLALAKALNLPVTIVSVIVPLTGFALQGIVQAEAMDSYNEGRRKEIEDLEQIIGEKAKSVGVVADFVSKVHLSPATAILETAAEQGCGLIVISSHGRRGISRLMLGSQTSEVLSEAGIPVLVVK